MSTRRAAGVRHDAEFDGLEIHHERIGHDVVRAIRPAVEFPRILGRQGERRIVDDDVAVDGLQPLGAQRPGEAPPALQGHVGIAASLQDQDRRRARRHSGRRARRRAYAR